MKLFCTYIRLVHNKKIKLFSIRYSSFHPIIQFHFAHTLWTYLHMISSTRPSQMVQCNQQMPLLHPSISMEKLLRRNSFPCENNKINIPEETVSTITSRKVLRSSSRLTQTSIPVVRSPYSKVPEVESTGIIKLAPNSKKNTSYQEQQ